MLPQNKNSHAAVGQGDYDPTQETPVVSSRTISSQRKGKSQLLKLPGGLESLMKIPGKNVESLSRSPLRELEALKSGLAIEKIDEGRKKTSDVSKLDGLKTESMSNSEWRRFYDSKADTSVIPTNILHTEVLSKKGSATLLRAEDVGISPVMDVSEGDSSINAREGGVVVPAAGAQHGSSKNKADNDGSPASGDSTTHGTIFERTNLKLDKIVLKFTTMAEDVTQQSFVVGRDGASIGQGSSNSICIKNDAYMSETEHAIVEWREGSFYLLDQGQLYGAAIRIGMGLRRWDWPLAVDTIFSAGCSVFRVSGFDEEGCMMLEILSGPLKGERRRISKGGATLGRSTDNSISIPDKELSRKHSKIQWLPDGNGIVYPYSTVNNGGGGAVRRYSTSKEFAAAQQEEAGGFYLTDVGSTNGSYMRLVGPYASSLRLELSDHILIGRTGFSINRYDWGVWEDCGVRRTMEDKSVIIQHMGIKELNTVGLSPQTYMAVYDGHGGVEAADYLWQHLHVNVADALGHAAPRIVAAARKVKEGRGADGGEHDPSASLDEVICEVVKQSFIETDAKFIATSSRPQCGSTATTVIVLGNRFYSFNVGDSRTVLCRKNANIISADHKPSREDEHTRIKEAGGLVVNKRVMGELAVSRAFGDKEFKIGIKSIMSDGGESAAAATNDNDDDNTAEDQSSRDDVCGISKTLSRDWKDGERPEGEEICPETHAEPPKSPTRSFPREWNSNLPLVTAEPEMLCSILTEEDEFVLLACDGLFDVYSTEETVGIIRAEMGLDGDAQRTCEVLTERAISERYSRDNVSVVLMVFSGMKHTFQHRQERF